MKFIRKLNIIPKLNLYFNILIISILSLAGVLFFFIMKSNLLKDANESVNEQLEELVRITDLQIDEKQKMLISSLRVFNMLFQEEGKLTISNTEKDEIEINNQFTHETKVIELNRLYLGGEQLLNNYKLVDKIQTTLGITATIFQKIDDGYLRISTNVYTQSNERAVGTFIPNSSPVVYSIENGEIYTGKAYVVSDWYFTAYKPFYVNGKINGMLYVGIPEQLATAKKELLASKTFFEKGFPYIMDENGNYLYIPINKPTQINNTEFLKKIKKAGKSDEILVIKHQLDKNNNDWRYDHIIFHKPSNNYIAIAYYESDILKPIYQLRNSIILTVLLSSLIIIAFTSRFLKKVVGRVIYFKNYLEQLSTGHLIEIKDDDTSDEIGKSVHSIKKLIQNLRAKASLAENIKKGNLDTEIEILSEDDILGKTLVELNNHLKISRESEEKTKIEEEIRRWINQGIAKFVDILRYKDENKEELFYNIISNLVHFVNANQGGFFIINDQDKTNIYAELVACYAYNRKRMIENKIPIKSGLIGRVVKEKKSIHLSEIPSDYLSIASGLGDHVPTQIFIHPLIYNDNVYGIIEIASFEEFLPQYINFIEEIGESIASTVASLKISSQTEVLLQQSQEQSQLMKQQELEMRKNLEILRDLKEKADTRELEMQGVYKAINTTQLVIEYDTSGRIISINDKFLKLFNLSAEDVVGKNHKEFTTLDSSSTEYKKFWNDLINGKTRYAIEALNVHEKHIWVSQTFTPIFDQGGNVYKILNIAMDITENKTLEKQLRLQVKEIRAQEKSVHSNMKQLKKTNENLEKQIKDFDFFTKTFDNLYIRIEYDETGKIIFANSRFIELLGFEENLVLGKSITLFLEAGTIDDFRETIDKIKKGYKIKCEFRFMAKTGNSIILYTTQSGLFDTKNNLQKIIMIANEITN